MKSKSYFNNMANYFEDVIFPTSYVCLTDTIPEKPFIPRSKSFWSDGDGKSIDITKKYPELSSYAFANSINSPPSFIGGDKFMKSKKLDVDDLSKNFGDFLRKNDLVGAISDFRLAPTMEASLTVHCFLGSPRVCRSSVSFSSNSLAKSVWLNNNLDVINGALTCFNSKAKEAFGVGNVRFNVVSGDGTRAANDVEIQFEYLYYDELVIKACLKHHVKHEGMDPSKILGDVAATCEFYLVGEMDVDDENNILQFDIQELRYLNRFHNTEGTLIKL